MRSKPGYSGSPVLVYANGFGEIFVNEQRAKEGKGIFVYLLGVNWGHIEEKRPLMSSNGTVSAAYVTEASGMNGVVPAWRITEIFKQPEVAELMKKREELAAARMGLKRTVTTPTVAIADQSVTGENSNHREDFKSLLNVAAQKLKPAE
jgi:hypothetical protein